MKVKCLYFVLYVLGAVCVWQKNQVKSVESDVFLENVEALADFEAMFGPGNQKIHSAITEHKFNHEGYRWAAVIECEADGKYDCKAGLYGRNKETDPWVRIG